MQADDRGHRAARCCNCYVFDKLGRTEVDEAEAGDIVAVVGLEDVEIGDTIGDPDRAPRAAAADVDEPTLEMVFAHQRLAAWPAAKASTSPAGTCASG